MSTESKADQMVLRIQNNPAYQNLRKKRNTFGWTLTIMMLVVYYGYVGLIAFDKSFLAQPIGSGVTSVGMPIGLGVILFTIIITGIYVYRANTEFDAITEEIMKDATQ